jgi:hypothetical protein
MKIFKSQFSRLAAKQVILKQESGQALVTLLFFMLIGIAVTSSAIAVLITNAVGTSYSDQGTQSYYIAESGIEDATLKLLRNPNYTSSGYTISIGDGAATVTIGNGYATSSGKLANTVRKIQIQTVYNNNNVLTISSRKEIQ